MRQADTGPVEGAWRARLTDPAVPMLALTCGATAAGWYGSLLTWAILGGLAGYSLSGSV